MGSVVPDNGMVMWELGGQGHEWERGLVAC